MSTSMRPRGEPRRALGLCFARRRREPLPAPDLTGLAPGLAQDLADALPFLLCGEESAVHVFSRRWGHSLGATETLAAIAAEERFHAAWLDALARALPPPQRWGDAQAAVAFFRGLPLQEAGPHFSAIAALDLAVCRLLAPLTGPTSPLLGVPALAQGLRRICQDEARHVRLARSFARRLGVDALAQRRRDLDVAASLRRLLAPVQPGLQRLGVSW